MTKENVVKQPAVDFSRVMKENPELAKRMELQRSVEEDSKPIKVFENYNDAKALFGFMDPVLGDGESAKELTDSSTPLLLGTGLVNIKENKKNIFIPYLTGKDNVNIALNKFADVTSIKVTDKNRTLEYPNDIKLFRILILTDEQFEVGKCEEKETRTRYRVLTHVDSDDFVKFGNHFVCKKQVPFSKDPNTSLSVEDTIYIDIDNNKITFVKDKDDDNNVYVIPIVLSADAYNSIVANVDTEWDKIKDDFIEKLIDGYTDPQKIELRKYLTSKNVVNSENPYFDKATAVFAYNNGKVIPLVDAINTNVDGVVIDELNVISNLFPKYGDENINTELFELDETNKLPKFEKKDINNLKIIGFDENMLKSIIDTCVITMNTANEIIANHTDEERKNILTKSYDSECRCITLLFENKDKPISELMDENEEDFQNVFELANFDKLLDESLEHKKDILHQLCDLKLASMRVQSKIDSGEFTNMYSNVCNNYFSEFYERVLKNNGLENDKIDISIFPKLIKMFNLDFAKFEADNDTFLKDKLRDSYKNTLDVNVTRNKFGSLPSSLFTLNENFVDSIIDLSAIPENISDEEKYNKILQQVFTKFDYIKSIAKRPFNFITKVYPSVRESLIGHDVSNTSEYAELLGIYDFASSSECMDIVNKIVDKIKTIRATSYNADNVQVYNDRNNKLTKYSTSLDKRKAKSLRDVAKIGANYVAVLENHNYLESITTRLSVYEENVKNIPEEKLSEYFIKNTKDDTEYNISEYDKLVEKTGTLPEGYIVLHKTSDEENLSIVLDFVLKSFINIAFIMMISRLSGKFVDFIVEKAKNSYTLKNKEIGNLDRMFATSTSLMVPSISALEDENVDLSHDHIEISELFPNDAAIKLGVDAVKNILKDLQTKDNLIEARKEYLKECLTYVWTIVSVIDC